VSQRAPHRGKPTPTSSAAGEGQRDASPSRPRDLRTPAPDTAKNPGNVPGCSSGSRALRAHVVRRRVTKLYAPGRYFLCRHCSRLAYASQSEDLLNRSVRQASKIKQRLGGNGGMDSPFPPRPKGMWRRTYERLSEQVVNAEMRVDEAFVLQARVFLARTENAKSKRSFWR
jgi:hypothetical protein